MMTYLEIREKLQPTYRYLFDRAYTKDFRRWPASSDKHHNWDGGLATHTLEVINIAIKMAEIIPANIDVLIVAGMWHDYGKLWAYGLTDSYSSKWDNKSLSYKPCKVWIDTQLKKWTGGHIARSYSEFRAAANLNLTSEDFIERVAHCILSHHQFREWGSPTSPQTNEAWILHLADNASAKCMGVENEVN